MSMQLPALLKMKLFRAFGGEEQFELQRHVNAWLADAHNRGIDVVKTETSMCSIGGSEQIYQHMTVVIWYSQQAMRETRE